MNKTTKAQIKATEKYQQENIKRVVIKINKKTESDLLSWCDKQDNLQGSIKELIKRDMTK